MAAPVAAVAAPTPPRPTSVYSTRSPSAARTLDSTSAPRPASVVIASVRGAEGGAEAIAARRRNSGSFKHMSTGGLVSNSPFQKLAGVSPTKGANAGLGLYTTSRIPASAGQGGLGRRTSGSRKASAEQDGPVKENSNPSELSELAFGGKKSNDSLSRSRSSSPGAPLMPVGQATASTSSTTAVRSASPFKPTRAAFGSATRNTAQSLDDVPRRQTSSFAALRQGNLVSSSPFTSKSTTAPSPELQQAPYEIEPLTRESAPSAYYELPRDETSPQLASSAKMTGQMGLGARPGPASASAGGRVIAGSSVPPPNTPPRERYYASDASPSSLRSPGGSALAQTRRGMRGPRPISGGYDDGEETEREDAGRTVRRQPSSKSVAWAETEEVFEFEVEDERRRSGLSDASTLSDEGRYYGHDSSDEESDSPNYTHQPDGSFTYEEGGSVEVHDVEVGSDADESVVSSASSAMDEVIGQIDEYLHEESATFDETDVFSPSQIPSFADQPDLPSHHNTSGYSSPNIPQAPASAFSISTVSGTEDGLSEVMSASSYDDDDEEQHDAHFTATKEAILSRGRASLPDAPGSPGRPPLTPPPVSIAAATLAPQQFTASTIVKSESQFSLPDIPGTSPFLGFEDDGAARSVVTLDGDAQPLALPATKPLQPRPHEPTSKTAPPTASATLGPAFVEKADRPIQSVAPTGRVAQLEASPVLSRKASLVGSDVTTSSVSWYGSSVNGSLRGGTIRLGRDRLEERMKAHQALFGDSSPLPSFGAFPPAAKTGSLATSQPSAAESCAIEAHAAPKARSATLSFNMMPAIAASPQRAQLGVGIGSPLTAEVAEEMQSPLERLQLGMKGREGAEWRSGDSLLGVAEVAEDEDEDAQLAPPKSGRPTRRRSRSTGDASIAETSSTALQAQLTMPELGFERKAGDAGFGSSVLESLDDIYNSRNRTYRVRESKQLVVVSDFVGSRAGDVDPGRAWRKKRPSDVHAINRSLSTMSVNSQAIRKSREYAGQLFVLLRDVSFEGMPMPRQRVSVTATLDNGRQKVDAAVRELSNKVSLKKEFELICNQDLAFSIHFSVPQPRPSNTPTMSSAPSSAPTPPASPSKAHRALRLFSSPKKKPMPSKTPPAPPPTPDRFFDYVSADGQLATARVTFAGEAAKCRLKKTRILVPFMSKSSSSPRSCTGALTVDLLFVPAVSGVPKANLPKSMDEVLEGLELAEWATKFAHEGVLTQLGGDTTVWRRRIVKLRGSTLVPYSEVTKRSHVEINLALVSQIEDLNVATVQSPKSRASRFEDEDEDLSRMDNSFRLVFKDGNRIDFFADSPEAKATWLSVLSGVVGKEDGKKAPPDWAVAVRKLPPPKSY